MEGPTPQSSPRWTITDPRRERVRGRLQLLLGDGSAAFFGDACRLVDAAPAFGTVAHLVAHCLREVESALRETLRAAWGLPREQGKEDGKHSREIARLSEALGIPGHVQAQWQLLSQREGALSPHGWAHRRNLCIRPADASFQEFFEHVVTLFDHLLGRIEAQALRFYERVDELTSAPPSHEAARELADRLPHNPRLRDYFFAKLQSPGWIGALSEAGLFSDPPAPIRWSDGGISFPRWPATEYLKRVAASGEGGDQVLSVVLAVDTENPWVQADLIEVVLQLAPKHAASFVPKVETWLSSSEHLALVATAAVRLDALLTALCEAGEAGAALQLAGAMWALGPDPRAPPGQDDDTRWLSLPTPSVRIDRWHYVQTVQGRVPGLVVCCGLAALEMLCALLDSAIRFGGCDEEDTPDDGSLTWSPTLGPTGREYDDLRATLVQAAFSAAQQLLEGRGGSFAAVASVLNRWPWLVFERIVLGLGRLANTEEVWQLLVDRRRLEAWCPEYCDLLSERFAALDESGREVLLGWVEQGPDHDKTRARLAAWEGREPTAEEVETARRRWSWRRLRGLRGILDREQSEHLGTLDQEFETRPPSDPQGGGQQDVEKRPLDELASLSDAGLLAYLASPPSGEDGPPGSGGIIHADLANAAFAYPARFSSIAASFRGAHPAYARSLLEGLCRHAEEARAVAWGPVLELCLWILRQRPSRGNSGVTPEDPWKWEYIQIARVISRGLGDGSMPLTLRMPLWEVISLVVADPEPISDDGEDVTHAADLSLNRTRSRGLYAAVQYAAWVRAHEVEGQTTGKGMAGVPEARSVLEMHLDPGAYPSIAVRAVYGLRFSELVRLDAEWARVQVPRVFPEGDADRRLYNAAWLAHVTHGELTREALVLLRAHYSASLSRMSDGADAAKSMGVLTDLGEREDVEMSRGVAERIMSAYWRGWLPLSEQDGLIRQFFSMAPRGIRRHALAVVGDWLTRSGPLPTDVAKRLMELMEWRIGRARSGGAGLDGTELSVFGAWLSARALDDDWTFRQLESLLEVFGRVEPGHLVTRALARRSADRPLQAVRCLDLLVQNDREGWVALGDQDQMETIIVAAVRSGDPTGRRLAADVANRVAAHGNPSLKRLLDSA